MATEAGYNRLKVIVAEVYEDTYTTTGGVTKTKTAKRREIEKAVAEAVVRFAYDHGGYDEFTEALAPTGLWLELMPEQNASGGFGLASGGFGLFG